MFIIEFYTLPDGSKPVLDFIHSIEDIKLRAKVFRSLRLLESYGNRLGEPDTKAVGDGIFELRTTQGSNTVRNLYFYYGGRIIVVTNGFIKKTQKIPVYELETAKARKRDYEKRHQK